MYDNKHKAAVIPHAVHEFPDDCRAQAETYRKYYNQIKAGLTLLAQSQGMLPIIRRRVVCLPVCYLLLFFCGSKTWSLTLREDHMLRVLENRVLRKIFGPKRDEVTGEWRRLHNEEFNDLYCSPNIIRVTESRRVRWAGHVGRMGERRGAFRVFVGKPAGK